jgi:putative endonuclease
MPYFVYVIKSIGNSIHYIGSTSDLANRLADHNAGRSRFTKGHRPWDLILSEEYETKAEAIRREKYLKSGKGREIIGKLTKI